MHFITQIAMRSRPVTILAIIMLTIISINSYINMQRELFPQIEFPNLFIVTIYPNSNPEAITREITEPIENSISGISGIKEIRSTSTNTSSNITVTFDFKKDLSKAETELNSSIADLNVPSGVQGPFVQRINSDAFPTMELSITANNEFWNSYDIPANNQQSLTLLSALQLYIEENITPQISKVSGVSSVNLIGGNDQEVQIILNRDSMKKYGITSQQLQYSIAQNNMDLPSGSIDDGVTNKTVKVRSRINSLDSIRNLIIGTSRPNFNSESNNSGNSFPSNQLPAVPLSESLNDLPPNIPRCYTQIKEFYDANSTDITAPLPICVSDIGEVLIAEKPSNSISRTNGETSLKLSIIKDPTANTVDVTESIQGTLSDINLPMGISIVEITNDGPEIKESLNTLIKEGFYGFLFAIMIVFIFLVNFKPNILKGLSMGIRPTLVIIASIPLSILTAIMLMYYLTDVALNLMSLAGLAISVGRVVDDSIVVIENIYRHIQMGEDRIKAAMTATREVLPPIVASTLATVVVFVPLAFIEGLVGEFFSPFALAVSLALIASGIVSITAIPVLGSFIIRPGDLTESDLKKPSTLQKIYGSMLKWSLSHKLISLSLAILITLSSLGLLFQIPVTFFSSGNPEAISISASMPPGTSINRTNQTILEIEKVIDEYYESKIVENYSTTIGSADFWSGSSDSTNSGLIFVNLYEDPPEKLAETIQERLSGIDDAIIKVTEIAGGPPQGGVELNISGPNFEEVQSVSQNLETKLSKIEGISNISNNASEGKDEIVWTVDQEKASSIGLSTMSIAFQMRSIMSGTQVSEIEIDGKNYTIMIRSNPDDISDLKKLGSNTISGPAGETTLDSIAKRTIEPSAVTITRVDGKRTALIIGDITSDDTQSVGREVQSVIDSMNFPTGVKVSSGGIFDQIAEGFQDIFLAMGVGIVLVYLVMVATMGSLRSPMIIMISLPLSIVGALVLLFITGKPLGLPAMMGFLLLIGVVVTNAVVLIVFVEQLRAKGFSTYDAIIEGGKVRVRPILMTAFATIFALIPLALASETNGLVGSELATVVIGGLVSSTFLTLLVVPIVYQIFFHSIPNIFKRDN